jgi:hypothetical protein
MCQAKVLVFIFVGWTNLILIGKNAGCNNRSLMVLSNETVQQEDMQDVELTYQILMVP